MTADVGEDDFAPYEIFERTTVSGEVTWLVIRVDRSRRKCVNFIIETEHPTLDEARAALAKRTYH